MQDNSRSVQYRFDFLKYRSLCVALSIVTLVVGIVAYTLRGGFSYHIDFTGGVEIRVTFEKELSVSEVRAAIGKDGWHDAVIQEVGNTKRSFIICIGTLDNQLEEKIKTSFAKNFSGNAATIDNIEWVGAEAGKDTQWNAFKAILLALVVLLLYIAVRSEFSFGVGATLGLIHDILVILVFMLITNEPVSLHALASLLAVLGFSLNDTIVIFSRIRENFAKLPGVSEYDIVNLSINQTLTRTILTSVCCFISVLAIYFLGGETLRGLSIIFLIGIIVGTYSSIYMASAGMLAVRSRKKIS